LATTFATALDCDIPYSRGRIIIVLCIRILRLELRSWAVKFPYSPFDHLAVMAEGTVGRGCGGNVRVKFPVIADDISDE
jgi:hypothetical protein